MRRLLAGLLLLGLTACGSTVPAGQQASTASGINGVQASADPSSQTELPSVAGTDAGAGSTGTTGGGAGGSGSTGGSATSEGTSGSSTSGALPGTSGTTQKLGSVEVGFEYATGVTAFAAALGISGDVGDGMQQATAMVTYVNAHGGLGGHQIKPVFYALDLTRTDPYSQFMQEMCTLWTQDHHVVAAFAIANADFTPVAQCLSKKHAVFSSYSNYSRQHSDFTSSPDWVETSTLSSERLAALQISTFAAKGFFTGQKKVGLLAYDYPAAAKLSSLLVSGLKARGITTVVYPVHYGDSTPELGGTIASVQSAVLRFRSEGIVRVMSAAYPGAIAFFMRYADSQSYRPLYGLSSYDALAALPANAPVSQLHGAIATGWWPTADLSSGDKPPLNVTGKTCRAVFSKASIPATQDATSFGYCDEVLSLQAAARLVTSPTLNGDGLRHGLESLGTSYLSPSMLGTRLTAGQHDGIAMARPMAFNDSCSCWRVSGGTSPIP